MLTFVRSVSDLAADCQTLITFDLDKDNKNDNDGNNFNDNDGNDDNLNDKVQTLQSITKEAKKFDVARRAQRNIFKFRETPNTS